MNDDNLFRLLFFTLWIAFAIVRIAYHRRAGTHREAWTTPWEGRLIHYLRLFVALPWMLCMLVYLLAPHWLRWSALGLDDHWRWTGAALMATGGALVLWTNAALDRNFSTTLVVREDHTLVDRGPYRWVRHPMYSAFVVMAVGMTLLSDSWILGGVPLFGILFIMLQRTPREEAMLLEHFGERYREYMARTGRFLPRRRREGAAPRVRTTPAVPPVADSPHEPAP